jgi:hypothetical protein
LHLQAPVHLAVCCNRAETDRQLNQCRPVAHCSPPARVSVVRRCAVTRTALHGCASACMPSLCSWKSQSPRSVKPHPVAWYPHLQSHVKARLLHSAASSVRFTRSNSLPVITGTTRWLGAAGTSEVRRSTRTDRKGTR